MNRIRLIFLLFFSFFIAQATSAITISGVWDTNWRAMTLWQYDASITGEYIYDNGVLIGTLHDHTFTGWWKEYNNSQTCGPNGSWSGAVVFKFSTDVKHFTGDWNYCGATAALDPDGTRWTGTRRETNTYEQTECESAGRAWCNNSCQLMGCNETLSEDQCLSSGRNWCSGTCQIAACDTGFTESDCTFSGKYWCNGQCQTTVCSLTDTAACEPATLSNELSLHIPNLKYTPAFGFPMILWVDLEATVVPNSDTLHFKLKDYGIKE